MKKQIPFLFLLLAALFLSAPAMAKDTKPKREKSKAVTSEEAAPVTKKPKRKIWHALSHAFRHAGDSDAASDSMIGTFSGNPTYQNSHALPPEEQSEENPEDTGERSQRVMRDIMGVQEK